MGLLALRRSTTSSSDLRRVCLTRLCSAFRLSQPLDALLRRPPSSLVSCRWRPWALHLQRVSLPRGQRCLSTAPAPPAVCGWLAVRGPRSSTTRQAVRLRGFEPRTSPYCQAGVTQELTADPLVVFPYEFPRHRLHMVHPYEARSAPAQTRRAEARGLQKKADQLHGCSLRLLAARDAMAEASTSSAWSALGAPRRAQAGPPEAPCCGCETIPGPKSCAGRRSSRRTARAVSSPPGPASWAGLRLIGSCEAGSHGCAAPHPLAVHRPGRVQAGDLEVLDRAGRLSDQPSSAG